MSALSASAHLAIVVHLLRSARKRHNSNNTRNCTTGMTRYLQLSATGLAELVKQRAILLEGESECSATVKVARDAQIVNDIIEEDGGGSTTGRGVVLQGDQVDVEVIE